MENVINFAPFWYLSIRITNSTGIWAKWINCLLYKVLIIPVLNKNCTEPYFGPLHRSYIYIYKTLCYAWRAATAVKRVAQKQRRLSFFIVFSIYIYIFILIKIIVQCSECKFPERVLLIGVISICKRFSKVSHRCETKPDVRPVSACNFYVLNIYIMTYNSRFICKTKK